MCGLWGWLGRGPTAEGRRQLMAAASPVLAHRGPDDEGFAWGDGWGLGFRRLQIIDLSPAGHQPMTTPDGRFRLIFNGEIYNYLELAEGLRSRGVRLVGRSDSEVLLHLLARDGADALTALNGMFAFAFVDTATRRFLLGRDRMGEKPLYLRPQGATLRFASELKGLLAWPDARHDLVLDGDAVADLLQQGYVAGERCIFTGYAKLPPGHVLSGSLDSPVSARSAPYWTLSLSDDDGTVGGPGRGPARGLALADAALDELDDLLSDAVHLRLRSDVPVGVFLSGGIDSGLIAAMAGAAAAKGGAAPPVALTVGFEQPEFDESDAARRVAEAAGLPHVVVPQGPAGLAQLDRLGRVFDEPFGDPSALPTLALCAAASGVATVFLAGDGGDEAFGGYRRYVEARRLKRLVGLPESARQALRLAARLLPPPSAARYRLAKAGLPGAGFAACFDAIPTDPLLAEVLSDDWRPALRAGEARAAARWAATAGRPLTTRQQALDHDGYLPDDILVKTDRASMAHSLEVRAPFLDHRLLEWAARLPRDVLFDPCGEVGKAPLRALAARRLPVGAAGAAKRGFDVPLDDWFRAPAGQRFASERLLDPVALGRGLWSARSTEGLLKVAAAGSGRHRAVGTLLWRLLAFDSWARNYLDGPRPTPRTGSGGTQTRLISTEAQKAT